MDFHAAFEKLIGHEGGFQNNPKDRGNWTGGKVGVGVNKGTKYGISAAQYPTLDIANLTLEHAKAIYLQDFWGPAGCDAVPDGIRFDLFDTAVNSGYRRAAMLVQKAVGEVADGSIGPRTLQAIGTMIPSRLVARFNAQRMLFITQQPDDWWDEFGKGLMVRIANNLLNA